MRSFVMLAAPVHGDLTNNIITIDHEETDTVLQLKHEILASQQSPLAVEEQQLWLYEQLLEDDTVLGSLLTPLSYRKLHLVLIARQCFTPELPYVLDHVHDIEWDSIDQQGRGGLKPTISLQLHCSIELAHVNLEKLVELRGAFNQLVRLEISLITADEDGFLPSSTGLRVRVVPSRCLTPNQQYSLRVCGHAIHAPTSAVSSGNIAIRYRDAIQGLATMSLPRKRLIIEHPQTNAKKLITVSGSVGVISEIMSKIATRFDLDPRSVVLPISDDLDYVQWPIDRVLRFELNHQVDLSSPAEYVHHDTPLLEWKQYRKVHWVNERAGFYVLSGKMTPEEETERLLEIVATFCDECERDRVLVEPFSTVTDRCDDDQND